MNNIQSFLLMKIITASLMSFVFLMAVSIPALAQPVWQWQNPLPQGNSLHEVFVVDENTIYAIGSAASGVFSDDGGLNWTFQSNIDDETTTFESLYFMDDMTGWVAGAGDFQDVKKMLLLK